MGFPLLEEATVSEQHLRQDMIFKDIDYEEVMDDGLRVWWQVSSPSLARSYFIAAQPPLEIPMPDIGQNELLVVEIPLTIDEFLGMSEKVEPTDSNPEIEEG